MSEAREHAVREVQAVQGDLDWYCLDHWSERLGLDVVQLHHDVNHRIGYLPGALEFLRQVHEQDIRVLLVTNSHPDTLALKDDVTGLGDYFDGVYSSHDSATRRKVRSSGMPCRRKSASTSRRRCLSTTASRCCKARRIWRGMLVTITRPDTTDRSREDPNSRRRERSGHAALGARCARIAVRASRLWRVGGRGRRSRPPSSAAPRPDRAASEFRWPRFWLDQFRQIVGS